MRVAAALLLALAAATAATAARAESLTILASTPAGVPIADLIAVLDPLDGQAPAAAAHPSALIDQIHKQFVPQVSVIRTGTAVRFPNSDRIRHQVYSFSPPRVFNLKLYAGTEAPPVVFDHAGLVVLGCNIHDSMAAFVAVVDTPYFGRTDAAGRLRLDAPAGHYRLRLWHPGLAQPIAPRPVTLAAEPRTIDVRAEPAADPALVTEWTD